MQCIEILSSITHDYLICPGWSESSKQNSPCISFYSIIISQPDENSLTHYIHQAFCDFISQHGGVGHLNLPRFLQWA